MSYSWLKLLTLSLIFTIYANSAMAQSNEYQIIVNVPATTLALYKNQKFVADYRVAVGSPIFRTPLQQYYFNQMVWNPSWSPPDSPWAAGASPAPPGPNNPLGPVKFPMQDGLRIHGTNKPGSIGLAASHGCIRMNNLDAIKLGQYLQQELLPNEKRSWENAFSKNRGTSYFLNLPQKVAVSIIYEPMSFVGNMIIEYPNVYGRSLNTADKLLDYMMQNGIYSSQVNLLPYKYQGDKRRQNYLPELVAGLDQKDNNLFSLECKYESKSSIYQEWLKVAMPVNPNSDKLLATNQLCLDTCK